MEPFYVNERLRSLAADGDTFIFHPHTARTAGRTFRERVLSPVYGAQHVYCRQHVADVKPWKKLGDDDLRGFRAYTDLTIFEEIGLKRPLVCMAVLRHPVYRAVSLYWFVRRKKDHRHYAQAQRYPLEEFYRIASDENPAYFRDLQCRRICGQPDVNVALKTIAARYIGVGFTHNLGEFVGAMGALFGWPSIALEAPPPDAQRYDAQISPGFRDMVLKENAHDMALFDAAANGLKLEPATAPAAWSRLRNDSAVALAKIRTKLSRLASRR